MGASARYRSGRKARRQRAGLFGCDPRFSGRVYIQRHLSA
ncbi:Uncharacterised protein [Vibrio cholerae]|nr:Uncharacterised protein [Vibrio cholerae]